MMISFSLVKYQIIVDREVKTLLKMISFTRMQTLSRLVTASTVVNIDLLQFRK